MSARPTCWNCGYELTGIRVDGSCPECGTPVWSRPEPTYASPDAQQALIWGIVSLCLFFVCLGPLAGLVAIPAVVKANRALEDVHTGRVPPAAASNAKAGKVLGWITISLSLAFVALYVLLIGAGMLGSL